jgi:hypothetical protein
MKELFPAEPLGWRDRIPGVPTVVPANGVDFGRRVWLAGRFLFFRASGALQGLLRAIFGRNFGLRVVPASIYLHKSE